MDNVTTFDQCHDHHQDNHHRDHHDDDDDNHDNLNMPGVPTPVVILEAFLAAIHTVSPVPLKCS